LLGVKFLHVSLACYGRDKNAAAGFAVGVDLSWGVYNNV
jgi:hypothetical protein